MYTLRQQCGQLCNLYYSLLRNHILFSNHNQIISTSSGTFQNPDHVIVKLEILCCEFLLLAIYSWIPSHHTLSPGKHSEQPLLTSKMVLGWILLPTDFGEELMKELFWCQGFQPICSLKSSLLFSLYLSTSWKSEEETLWATCSCGGALVIHPWSSPLLVV